MLENPLENDRSTESGATLRQLAPWRNIRQKPILSAELPRDATAPLSEPGKSATARGNMSAVASAIGSLYASA